MRDIILAEKEKLDREYEEQSSILAELEEELRCHAVSVIFMINRLSCYEAVERGDGKENIRLAAASDTRKKSKMKITIEKCSSEFCFISKHDINVNWVECNSCDNRYHSMCEGHSPMKETSSTGEYNCTNCSGHETVPEVINRKIDHLLSEEDKLNDRIVEIREKCDNLKAAYNTYVGPNERSLLDALESLKVVRQAYHGNVMVGNHCHKVLEDYQTLTRVLPFEVERQKFDVTSLVKSSLLIFPTEASHLKSIW